MKNGEKRITVTDSNLSVAECEIIMKALSSYQIHLYDMMKRKESPAESDPIKLEVDAVTNAIKKIHRVMKEAVADGRQI